MGSKFFRILNTFISLAVSFAVQARAVSCFFPADSTAIGSNPLSAGNSDRPTDPDKPSNPDQPTLPDFPLYPDTPVTPAIPDSVAKDLCLNDFPDPEYKRYPLPPDVGSALNYPVMGIPVNVEVTSTGAATFSIPIDVPPGVGAAVPQLSVIYNSMSVNGILGMGCGIQGFSSITRTAKDIYHDKCADGLAFSDMDALRLDGKRLVVRGNGVFVPEDSPFTQVIEHGSGTNRWFEVRTPDGRKIYYGSTENSRQTMSAKGGIIFVNSWQISRVEDNNGNFMTYSYLHDNNMVYPLAISYGGNMHTGGGAENAVTFSYRERADQVPFVVNGISGRMSRILSGISTKTGDAKYREISFVYRADNGSNISLLSMVKTNMFDGKSTRPIEIGWKENPGFLPAARILDTDSDVLKNIEKSNIRFLSGDINGDGVSDFLEIANVCLKFGTKKTYTSFCMPYVSNVNTDGSVSHKHESHIDLGSAFSMDKWKQYKGNPFLSDINGDGIQDFVVPYYDNLSKDKVVALNIYWGGKNGISASDASGVAVKLINTDDLPLYTSADFNNDGRNEILLVEPCQGNIGMNVCQIVPYAKNGESFSTQKFNIVFNFTPRQLFSADFNGDGLVDFMLVHDGGCYTYLNKGSGTSYTGFTTPVADVNVKSSDLIDMGDFNGDGIPDFVMFSDGKLTIATGNGDGHFTKSQAQTIKGLDKSGFSTDYSQTIVYDFDNDGKSDLMLAKADKSKGNTFWLRSAGSSFELKRKASSTRRSDSTYGYFALGDFNGDGYPEVMNYGSDVWNGTDDGASLLFRAYPNNVTPSTGKVCHVKDAYSNTASFTYKSFATGGLYTKATDAKFPVVDCMIPLHAVSTLTRSNGAAGSNTTEFRYYGLKTHVQGRGILGMSRFSSSNCILGTSQCTEVTLWNGKFFAAQNTKTTRTAGDAVEMTETTVEFADKGNTAFFAYPKYVKATDADGNITESTLTFDAEHGYKTESRMSYDDGAYTATEYGEYINKNGIWLAQSIKENKKHPDDNSVYIDESRMTYDDFGNVHTTTAHAGTSKEISTIYLQRDSYGNVVSSTTEGNGTSGIMNYTDYDSSGRFPVKRYTVPETTTVSYKYNIFGNLLSETDETIPDKKLTTEHGYDSWGRETRTTFPSGACVKTCWGWGTDSSKRYYKLTYCLGQPWEKIWYDSCGREVQAERVADGGLLSTMETTFDSKGLVIATKQIRGKLVLKTTNEYDSWGRLAKTISDTGKTIVYLYGNRSVTTTENKRTTVKEYDATGNIRKITDPVTVMEYSYWSNGKPKEISCDGNVVRMEYDEAGNRIVLDDPDAGKNTCSYDAEGKILFQTDGRGVTRSYHYDELGRLVRTTGALSDITYKYDKRNNVISEEHNGNRITSTFDGYDRIAAQCREYDDGEWQAHNYKYDKFNNIVRETFPDGIIVNYVYDVYGNNTAYIVNGDTVWAEKADDGLKASESVLGGSIVHTTNLDTSGFLSELSLSDSAGKGICGFNYRYDGATGNLTRRSSTGSKTAEYFTYDKLDRLVTYQTGKLSLADNILPSQPYIPQTGLQTGSAGIISPGSGMDNSKFQDRNTAKYTYSNDGNILTSPIAGKYTYCSDRPHAVESVSNPNDSIPLFPQYVSYNNIGKADAISEEKEEAEFSLELYYGPNSERWTTILTKSGNPIRTIYFGDGYEKVVDGEDVKEFTYLGNGLLFFRENGDGGKMLYMFTDAQGSICDIRDKEGNTFFLASYDPWGNARVTKNDIGFIRGYTGHEMLTDFSLINMNGRLYDPKLGRFLSPDNYVQMPDNSQNFNRYSYCLNNPLKYTDPSGEVFVIDDLLVFLAGGTFNVIGNAVSGDIKSFWHGAELFAVGGAASLATEYAGPMVGAVIIGAGNSIINQGNTNGWGNISWSEVGTSTIMSCLTSAAGQYLTSTYSSLFENYTGGITNDILKKTLNQSVANSLSGFTLGSAMSLASGANLDKALECGLHSAAEGAIIGAASGYMQGLYEHDVNTTRQNLEVLDKEITPEQIVSAVLNNPLTPKGTGTNSVYLGRDYNNTVRYVGITQRKPQERFSEHLRSKSNRSALRYERILGTGNLSRRQALIIEQTLVNLWKMEKKGGALYNKINPITPLDWNKYGIK